MRMRNSPMTFWPRNKGRGFWALRLVRLFMGFTEGVFIGWQFLGLRPAQGKSLASRNG
jgi:hypothetical protein